MKNAVDSGTGTKAKISGYEVAGKTGTNSDYASVFFAGMTCKYTSVVWIGHDLPSNKLETSSTGGDYAAVLWNRYMTKLMEGVESHPIIPENESTLGLVQRTVCPISGKLATDACIHYKDYCSATRLVKDGSAFGCASAKDLVEKAKNGEKEASQTRTVISDRAS